MIKLTLALLLALSLSGCSKNKHQDLLDMLDKGEYNQAVDYINNLAYEAKKDELSKIDFADKLAGTWEVAKADRQNSDKITFEGNKIHIGNQTFLWEEINRSENSIRLNILDGASQIGNFNLRLDHPIADLNVNIDGKEICQTYANMSKYEEITITKDNFRTYFEEIKYESWNKNSFKEATSLIINRALKLKDEYIHNYTNYLSSVALEVKYNHVRKNIDVDYKNQTYTIKGTVSGSQNSFSKDGKFAINSHTFDKDTYIFNLPTDSVNKDSTDQTLWYYMTDWSIERVEGKIYILKK